MWVGVLKLYHMCSFESCPLLGLVMTSTEMAHTLLSLQMPPRKLTKCGTYGCMLPDRHSGLHSCPEPASRLRGSVDRANVKNAATALMSVTSSLTNPDHAVAYDIQTVYQICIAGRPPEIMSKDFLPSLRVRRKGGETSDGDVVKLSFDKKSVYVAYDSLRKWESIDSLVFL